jgi:hypothetical protein
VKIFGGKVGFANIAGKNSNDLIATFLNQKNTRDRELADGPNCSRTAAAASPPPL